jgi:hypothetical protein
MMMTAAILAGTNPTTPDLSASKRSRPRVLNLLNRSSSKQTVFAGRSVTTVAAAAINSIAHTSQAQTKEPITVRLRPSVTAAI